MSVGDVGHIATVLCAGLHEDVATGAGNGIDGEWTVSLPLLSVAKCPGIAIGVRRSGGVVVGQKEQKCFYGVQIGACEILLHAVRTQPWRNAYEILILVREVGLPGDVGRDVWSRGVGASVVWGEVGDVEEALDVGAGVGVVGGEGADGEVGQVVEGVVAVEAVVGLALARVEVGIGDVDSDDLQRRCA
jgi:hypothetical protein